MSSLALHSKSWSRRLHETSLLQPDVDAATHASPAKQARAAAQTGRGELAPFPRERTSYVLALDRLACALRAAADRVVLPTARAAAAFHAAQGWRAFGDARLEDHAREHFGRSARWVREQVRLHHAVTSRPALAAALTGADGGAPIGAEKAKVIARLHDMDDVAVAAWIARARASTLATLRAEVRAALDGAGDPAADDLEPRRTVVIEMPAAIAVAFDEVCELARATAGRELSLAGAVDALLAETHPVVAGDVPMAAAARSRTGAWIEGDPGRPRVMSIERSRPRPADDVPAHVDDSEVAFRARTTLAEFRLLDASAGRGGPRELHDQLKRLVAFEDALLRRLGEVVAKLADRGAWATLPFGGIADYAERRLGMSATAVDDRVRTARALSHWPQLRAAYDGGRIGLEAASLARRALGRGAAVLGPSKLGPYGDDAGRAARDLEKAWLDHAESVTIKRLRDEVRVIRRRAALETAGSRAPLTDEEWSAARWRAPGSARCAVITAGLVAAAQIEWRGVSVDGRDAARTPDVFQRLRLPESSATRLLDAIESARRSLTRLVESVPWDQPWPDDAALPSVRAARAFSVRARRVPAWAGLLALLEEAALTWDDPRGVPRRPGDAVYRRSGYRCEAPRCTARGGLHAHHVAFRSHGGSDHSSNLVVLCEAHHRLLHDAGLIAVDGRAPLDLTWDMGGARFRCDRRLGDER